MDKPFNSDLVRERVSKILAMAADDAAAHSEEDKLFQDVLAAIADGNAEDPEICAREALRSLDINFARWCV